MSEMNTEQARFNMIEQQIRPWDVLDQTVLDLIQAVPRENFVAPQYHNLAFADLGVPIGHGEVMMAPKVEARMLQALAIQPHETVLEIGTGSGYVTALLAKLARHVYSVELQADFLVHATNKLREHRIANVTLEQGDAAQRWELCSPYDVIAITGSLPVLPEHFQQTLNVGGRLFAIVGDAPAMEAMCITRVGQSEFQVKKLFETNLPPLHNALQPNRFHF